MDSAGDSNLPSLGFVWAAVVGSNFCVTCKAKLITASFCCV